MATNYYLYKINSYIHRCSKVLHFFPAEPSKVGYAGSRLPPESLHIGSENPVQLTILITQIWNKLPMSHETDMKYIP
jgi:hypothetical protein